MGVQGLPREAEQSQIRWRERVVDSPKEELLVSPIELVAHDWQPDRSEVDPDLVLTTRSWEALDQAELLAPLTKHDSRQALQPILPHPHLEAHRRAASWTDRCIDPDLLLLGMTFDQGEVALLNGLTFELLAHFGVGLGFLGDQDQTRGLTIEPMAKARYDIPLRILDIPVEAMEQVDERSTEA